jgi:small-conductance mechanosensitive channel
MIRSLLLLALLVTAAPVPAQPVKTAGDPAAAPDRARALPPATLTVWNRPIVVLRAPVRQVSPAERAATAARRIEALSDDIGPDDIRRDPATIAGVDGLLVTARHQVLFSILADDVDSSAGETLEAVSGQAVQRLHDVLRARAQQRRLPLLLRSIVVSLVAIAALVPVLWLVRRGAERALARAARETRPRVSTMLGMDLWPFLHGAERTIVGVTAWGMALLAVYLCLTFVLHQFPYTRPWGGHLGQWIVGLLRDLAAGALDAVPGLVAVLVIFVATRFVVRLLDALFRGIERGAVSFQGFQPDTAGATRRIATVLIWLFALTVAYPYIPGSDSEAFKAIGVFAGLMISLGSAGFVNQLMSGLVIVYSRALRAGETVRVGDVVGIVNDVRLLSTKIVTPRREEVTIPNAVLAGTTITNYSRLAGPEGPVVSTAVTIGYDAPWRQVHALLALAAERTPGVRREPRPYVVQRALSDFYVEYELRAHLEPSANRFQVLSDLHGQIQDAFNEYGVQIMSPHFEGQPGQPVVVGRSAWFTAPAPRPADRSGDGPRAAGGVPTTPSPDGPRGDPA